MAGDFGNGYLAAGRRRIVSDENKPRLGPPPWKRKRRGRV
jgi:hypothetical protein